MNDLPGATGAAELGTPMTLPEALPVLPLREVVAFPDTVTPLAVGQERSIKLVDDALSGNRMIVMVASRKPEIETPGPDDLYEIGVVGVIARMLKVPDGTVRILVQGAQRVRITDWVAQQPYLIARIDELPDVVVESPELTALTRNVQQTFSQIVEEVPYLPEELQLAVANVDDPSALSHLIAGALRIKAEEKQEMLEEADVAKRLRRLTEILARELDLISIGSKIQSQVQSEMDHSQREYFLRQQLKAIQEELGEADEMQAEANELREQLDAIELPEGVRRQVDRELSRLERLPAAAAEHGVIRTWLEWIAGLPWDKMTDDNLDLKHARKVLDEDHYDIDQVKDRRVPGGAQAQAGRARLDPVLRRPSRSGQDLAREVDRARPGPRVRAHQRRRRARRGRDPRTPADVHRGDAGHDPPRAARRGHRKPAVHDRRDRQDGRRLPRRSVERDARGPRSRAERQLPRPLPRPAV
jgi:ATP-dependent Lon protease